MRFVHQGVVPSCSFHSETTYRLKVTMQIPSIINRIILYQARRKVAAARAPRQICKAALI